MDFKLNEEQEAIRKMVADFTEKEIAPVAAELDEEERFPRDILEKLDQLGLSNFTVPEEYGGPGIDTLSAVVAAAELARGCAGVASALTGNSVALYPIVCAGSEGMKEKYLNEICDEGKLVSLALNEPEAGSNAAVLTSRYELEGDSYILNGEKSFISGATYADYFVVFAVNDSGESKKTSAFMVAADSAGIDVGEPERKMGLRASNTAGVVFKDVRVPAGNLIGREGDGVDLAGKTSALARIFIGALCIGLSRAALGESIRFARERIQFGKPIAANQAIQFMLADMAARIEAAELLVARAAWILDDGISCSSEAAVAKLVATESAMQSTVDAIQVLGGYGYSREYPVEKFMRDAKTLQIIEGTGMIQRMIIAGTLLGQTAP
ncbi:MAG: acyl-CoA dehydrogenase family protein [Bacillota bacterium]